MNCDETVVIQSQHYSYLVKSLTFHFLATNYIVVALVISALFYQNLMFDTCWPLFIAVSSLILQQHLSRCVVFFSSLHVFMLFCVRHLCILKCHKKSLSFCRNLVVLRSILLLLWLWRWQRSVAVESVSTPECTSPWPNNGFRAAKHSSAIIWFYCSYFHWQKRID